MIRCEKFFPLEKAGEAAPHLMYTKERVFFSSVDNLDTCKNLQVWPEGGNLEESPSGCKPHK